MKKNLTIIDVDGFIFYSAYRFKDQLNMIGSKATKDLFDTMMARCLKACDTEVYLGFYGAGNADNFRHEFATVKPYKGSRKSEPWHKFYKPILRKHFKEKWGFIGLDDIEADDAVVIAHWQFLSEYNITHIGEDKDFKQVGEFRRYNPKTKEMKNSEHWDGRKHLWIQLVVGDSSDNIPGIKGKGKSCIEVKNILGMEDPTEEKLFELVRDAYIETYGDMFLYMMVENYTLLNMLTTPKFDYPKEKPTPVTWETVSDKPVNKLLI